MNFQESSYLGKEQCPECKKNGRDTSKDNLHRWDDHAHCFSCHYHEFPDGTQIINTLASRVANEQKGPSLHKDRPLTLPDKAGKTFDVRALQWLNDYGIIRDEIVNNDLRWDDSRQWLIFPIRGANDELLAYQGRSFAPTGPKWENRGNTETVVHIIDNSGVLDGPIIMVEDIVSAIKVGRHARALCLFGSNGGLRRIMQIRHLTRKLWFWLDADKYKDSIKFAKNARMCGIDTRVIYTSKDPKEHSDEEIRNIIRSQ